MRRTLVSLLAAASLLAACAGSPSAGSTGTSPTNRPLTLLLFGGPDEVAGYEAMAAAFEDANPDLRLQISPVANQDDLLARLSTSFAAGAPPELFLVNFRKYGQFAEQDAIAPVQSYLDASDTLDESLFAEAPIDAFRFDGQELSCLPQNISTLVAYVNLDLFEQAGVEVPYDGWSWEQFLAAARAMTGDGTFGLGVEPSLIRLAPFVWSNGGEVVDDTDAPTRVTLDEGPAREAYDFFLDLSLVHGVVPPDAEQQSEATEARFLRGGLGMYLNSRRSTPTLRTITEFDWDVVPLPVAPGGQPATILHSDAYCISAGTGREDDAWRAIEFAMSAEGQEILAASGRTVPSRIDVLSSPAFLEPSEPPATAQVFVDNAAIARATPHVAMWAMVEKVADGILESAFYGHLDRETALLQIIEATTPLLARS
jgi:multiple sugar transport system substrate-binding protein